MTGDCLLCEDVAVPISSSVESVPPLLESVVRAF